MIEVEHTVEIDRPAEEVFEYLTDVSRLPEWQSSAVSAELDGALRKGARVREARTFMGRRAASTLEVTEYEPPRRFSLRVVEGPIRYSVEHALEALDGRTRVTFVGRGETRGVPRLMQGAVRRAVERQFVKDLEALKRTLESTDGQATSTLT
ncbi:MAG: SRPBCC family protein [Actinobacteria bacterium]|nr:SRPBCC family protein [Actinomycetota bacterium]